MPLKDINALRRDVIYAFIYGVEGCGKTRLPLTLIPDKDPGLAGYVTAEEGGPTSIISAGLAHKAKVWTIPAEGDPFVEAALGLEHFRKDPKIKVLVLDGCTMICGRAVQLYSGGKSMKQMGFEGWGKVLLGFQTLERICDRATRGEGSIPPKSVVMTAWEADPSYVETVAGPVLDEPGRPLLMGQAKKWLPGNCDIIGRLTGHFTKQPGKPGQPAPKPVWSSQIQVQPSREWLAKTRWTLPDPCPANLREILNLVHRPPSK